MSNNYDSLKVSANSWIESSSEGASTWNVFLLGNTKEIKSAIKDWNHQLCEFSEKKLSNEEFLGNETVTFGESSRSLVKVEKGLDDLTDLFTQKSFPNLMAIVTAVLLYLAMLFHIFCKIVIPRVLIGFGGWRKGIVIKIVALISACLKVSTRLQRNRKRIKLMIMNRLLFKI